jgi:PPOX class probable F420-dependent enzyme
MEFVSRSERAAHQKLYVYSEADSGKAKRIRRNSQVIIAACDMRGKLLSDWIEAKAEIVTGEEAGRGMRLLNAKYAPWKKLFDLFSRFKRRGRVVFAITSRMTHGHMAPFLGRWLRDRFPVAENTPFLGSWPESV